MPGAEHPTPTTVSHSARGGAQEDFTGGAVFRQDPAAQKAPRNPVFPSCHFIFCKVQLPSKADLPGVSALLVPRERTLVPGKVLRVPLIRPTLGRGHLLHCLEPGQSQPPQNNIDPSWENTGCQVGREKRGCWQASARGRGWSGLPSGRGIVEIRARGCETPVAGSAPLERQLLLLQLRTKDHPENEE